MLRSDACGNFVRRDEKKARDADITGVPYFLVDGKYHIKGNKKPEQFVHELLKAWDEKYADDKLAEPQTEENEYNSGH